MPDKANFSILDYVVLIVKWRRFLLIVAVVVFVVSYLLIFFLVGEEYDASATIMPSEEKDMGGISSLLKNFSGAPLGLGGSTKTADMDLYTTVINSRPMLEKIIVKFDLLNDYKLKSMEKAVDAARSHIKTRVTEENAYQIIVRASSSQKAADMANFLLEALNTTVVNMNVAKSRNNRIFLEERYNEMTRNLRSAEDSLQHYQETTGMFEAKEQTKLIITTYSTLEADLVSKQIQLSIMENMLSRDAPSLENLRIQVKEYEKKLDKMKREGESNGITLALDSLPSAAKHYIQHFRDVEIYGKILEFLVPMYEQARFDEQKNVPVLQVIEYPVPPEKKSYPPRTLLSLLITFGAFVITFLYVLLNENENWKKDARIIYIRENIKRWRLPHNNMSS